MKQLNCPGTEHILLEHKTCVLEGDCVGHCCMVADVKPGSPSTRLPNTIDSPSSTEAKPWAIPGT